MGGRFCKFSKDTESENNRLVMAVNYGLGRGYFRDIISVVKSHVDKIQARKELLTGNETSVQTPVHDFMWHNHSGRCSMWSVARELFPQADVFIIFVGPKVAPNYVEVALYRLISDSGLDNVSLLVVLPNGDDEVKDDSETTETKQEHREELKKVLEQIPLKCPNQHLEIIDSTMLDENIIERALNKVIDRRAQEQQTNPAQVSAISKKEAISHKLTKIWKAVISR